MRIVLCVNYDIIGCYALNKLLPALCPEHEVEVFLSDRLMKHKDLHVEALEQLQRLERDIPTGEWFPAIDADQDAMAAQPELLTFNGLAKAYDVPVELVKRINSPEGTQRFRDAAPDCILSIRYGNVFKQPIIDIPRYGIFNAHSGILPNYRGTMPTFRTMMNGAKEAGITLHRVPDDGIDTGDVVGIARLPIDTSHSMLWHVMELYPLVTELVADLVDRLARGEKIQTIHQDESKAKYYTFPTEEEVQAFTHAGFSFVNESEYQGWLTQFAPGRKLSEFDADLFLDATRDVA